MATLDEALNSLENTAEHTADDRARMAARLAEQEAAHNQEVANRVTPFENAVTGAEVMQIFKDRDAMFSAWVDIFNHPASTEKHRRHGARYIYEKLKKGLGMGAFPAATHEGLVTILENIESKIYR